MHGALKGGVLRVRGTVQGVGFRPWVWQLARECGIRGYVLNDAEGVLIEAWGEPEAFHRFVERLGHEPPPLSRIESIEQQPLAADARPPADFSIAGSRAGETRTAIAADAASCSACLAEVFDPADRRHGYPFTNCTHCGPRFSIIQEVPYDRVNTSMAPFAMCPECQSEYDDPADRRFHAQPNACPRCGPKVWLEDRRGNSLDMGGGNVLEKAAQLIREGRILAIKGLGGIHLACDATRGEAVAELRRRKQRYHKPFALMARDAAMIRRFAQLDDASLRALEQPAAPIVILNVHGEQLPAEISPGQHTLGFMLPYTPLHHLLMKELEQPIVLTSANSSDEPQCIGNQEAREKLGGIADFLLLHDRDIVTRLDDSVMRTAVGRTRMIRRARGFVPVAFTLPTGFDSERRVLAMGAELKSTFCLIDQGKAIVSQHLGDLENAATYHEYRNMLVHYQRLFDFEPELIVVDRHPDYLSTQLGKQIAQQRGLPLLEVQHHHAHMTACMAEHGVPADTPPMLGLILDGLGYGDDGAIWGGEFLLGDYAGFRRLAFFKPVAMPGGAMAMREPWRNTFAHLDAALGWEEVLRRFPGLELIRGLEEKPLSNIRKMVERGINSPGASSAGRLFDAVAGALGLCRDRATFEGQAAILLESLATRGDDGGISYPVFLKGDTIYWDGLWTGILQDLSAGTDEAVIAARFHTSLARGLATIAIDLCKKHGTDTLVLGGGVFQNKLLLEGLVAEASEKKINILVSRDVPSNDGAISFGQAVIGNVTPGWLSAR